MNATSLLVRLGMATLVFTALAGALMLARRPLRARLGAEAVYALWLLVPLGVALCAWPVHQVRVHAASVPGIGAIVGPMPADGAAVQAAVQPAELLLWAWLLGAMTSLVLLVARQTAFTRSLGRLQPRGANVWTSTRSDVGPVLVGLIRPRIVLPADVDVRYTAPEQAAVLAHERMHARRGDLAWNALCAVLRCVFWFHPLAAAAQRRYLADQELACDSAVLRVTGQAPRTYAEALLKTQSITGVPLGCGMAAASPLKERIVNLGRRGAPRHASTVVALALAGAALGGGGVAWAATGESVAVAGQAAAPATNAYKVTLDIAVDGGAPRHEEHVTRGPLHLDGLRDGEGQACTADLLPRGLANGAIDVSLRLVCAGQPAGNPRVVTKPGVPATVAVGKTERQPDGSYVTSRGFRLTVKVDPA